MILSIKKRCFTNLTISTSAIVLAGLVCGINTAHANYSLWTAHVFVCLAMSILVYINLDLIVLSLTLLSFCWGYYAIRASRLEQVIFNNTIANSPHDIIGIVDVIERNDTNHQTIYLESRSITSQTQKNRGQAKNIQLKIPATINISEGDLIKIHNTRLLPQMNHSKNQVTAIKPKKLIIDLLKPGFLCKIYSLILKLRAQTISRIRSKLSEQNFRMFSSLFLGKPAINSAHADQFNHWGISHYLARSGLHVVILLGIWHKIIRYAPLGFILRQALLIILLSIFYLLSYSSISFARASLTYSITRLYTMQQTPTLSTHTIVFCGYIFLLQNAPSFFTLSFQLSFSLAFFLAWLYEKEHYGHSYF